MTDKEELIERIEDLWPQHICDEHCTDIEEYYRSFDGEEPQAYYRCKKRQIEIDAIAQAWLEDREQHEVKAEIKAKIKALDKLMLGAGEYHDDPYEYVVRLSDLRNYRLKLGQFDLMQPVFRDHAHLTTNNNENKPNE